MKRTARREFRQIVEIALCGVTVVLVSPFEL
jgi:hypothetical protein